MEEIIPRPLNVVKMSQSKPENEMDNIYKLPYPHIPYRRSSIRAYSRHSSNDSTNSMVTAPEQIKVPKRNRGNASNGVREETEDSDGVKGSDKVRCISFHLGIWLTSPSE